MLSTSRQRLTGSPYRVLAALPADANAERDRQMLYDERYSGSYMRMQQRMLGDRVVFVPLKYGKPVPIHVPRSYSRGRPDIHTAATYGAYIGRIKPTDTVLNTSRRVVTLNGGNERLNEIVTATGVKGNLGAGHYFIQSSGISLSTQGRANPDVKIAGGVLHNPNFSGFRGNLSFTGHTIMVNPKFTNSAITFTGTYRPEVSGARTGGMVVDKVSFSGLADAAARHATDMKFDPARDAPSSFVGPSMAQIREVIAGAPVLGSAVAISNYLTPAAARALVAESAGNHAERRVRRRPEDQPVPV